MILKFVNLILSIVTFLSTPANTNGLSEQELNTLKIQPSETDGVPASIRDRTAKNAKAMIENAAVLAAVGGSSSYSGCTSCCFWMVLQWDDGVCGDEVI